ncbi:MAG: DUF2177 family protein [Saprospiraceae bacterium]|nr:DUF2177 family protein [Saprospiraceae bacterium]
MKMKKMLICTAVGTVFLLLIDYLWYALITIGPYEGLADIMRDTPLFLWLVLSYVIFSYVFCRLFPIKDGSGIMGGIRYGVMIGLMVYVSYALMRHATETPGSLSMWLIDSVYNIIKVGLLGVIIAALNGQGSRGDISGAGGGER